MSFGFVFVVGNNCCCCSWSLWVWESLQHRLRHSNRGAKQRLVSGGAELRCLLRNHVHGLMVLAGIDSRDRDQFLPTQLRASGQRRRMVQPTQRAFRLIATGVHKDRTVSGRHCASTVPESAVYQERRNPLHHQRKSQLQSRHHHQCGWLRSRGCREDARRFFPLVSHVPKLGPELAVRIQARWSRSLVHGHHQRWQGYHY